jgi:DNA polymerase-3 subunit delta
VDYAAFLTAAERGQPPALALLHGADDQLLDDALGLVTRGLFADASELALGREVLEGDEASVETVVRSAMTLPFMTKRRLIVVRRAQALPGKGGEALTAYARDPNPTTCLVLVASEPLAASRERRSDHWLLGAVPSASVVALPLRKGKGMVDWLRQRAGAEGLTVTEEAARLLVQWVGEDGARLLGEARKAALMGGPANHKVGEAEVTAVVGEHAVKDVFDLTSAVEQGSLAKALPLLDRLLATEEPIRLLALLTRNVRIALTVRELAAAGQSADQIARSVRPTPPFVVKTIMDRVAGPAGAALPRQLARCWEAEWRCKSGGQPVAELTALVAELCGAR